MPTEGGLRVRVSLISGNHEPVVRRPTAVRSYNKDVDVCHGERLAEPFPLYSGGRGLDSGALSERHVYRFVTG